MTLFGIRKEKHAAAQQVSVGGLPDRKFAPGEWRDLAAAFRKHAADPEFTDLVCRGNITNTERLLARLLKRQKSPKTDRAVAQFMAHPHLFNRLSRAEKEEHVIPLISAIKDSTARGDVLAAHAWLRNVLRRGDGQMFAPQIVELLSSLNEKDLARAMSSGHSHLAWTVKNYISTEDRQKLFDKAKLEI